MRQITEIIVHCSATAEGKDFTERDIDRWHRAKGWNGCGYHYVVRLDGTVEIGRAEATVGAHCSAKIKKGSKTTHNAISLGVCYIGGLAADGRTPKDTRTTQQRAALLALLKRLKQKYPEAKIYGHRDFAAKACPSFDAKTEYSNL